MKLWCQVPPPPGPPPPNPALRPTADQRFAAMSEAEQVETFGAETADKLRAGEVTFADLIDRSPQRLGDDYITQKSAQDLPP